MFCRKCGKTLLDGDRFCSYCGAQVIERNGSASGDENLEEVIYNDSSHPIEALSVVAPKKSIVQTWQAKSESKVDKHPSWNLEGFPTAGEETRKTEEIVVDWTNRHVEKSKIEENVEKIAENVEKKEELVEEESITGLDLEAELFGRKTNLQFEPGGAATDSIEKFYTFSKKNEEFQKLLDKEYERLKKGGLPERKEPINLEKLEIKPSEAGTIAGIEKILQGETKPDIPETNIGGDSTLETEKAADIHPFWPKAMVVSETPKAATIVMEAKSGRPTEMLPEEKGPVLEQNPSVELEVECKANAEPIINSDEEPDESVGIDSQETIEEPKTANVVFPWDENSVARQEFVDEDAGKKKISPVKVVLSVVIFLLVAEIGILGVKYFFPESGAAALINERLGIAANWVEMLKDSSDSKEPQEESDKKADEEAKAVSAPAETDQTAERELTEILDPLRVYNDNIKAITINEKLVYDKSKDYGDENINNSTPIEDNIWYQDKSGNNVYFDSEIFKTLISFNSLWIDYLNGKNTDVLLQTKEDSDAYNQVKNYSKVGKISEIFNSLELGEMRQGNKGYYIWVKEGIQVTENGKVEDKVIYNIYYLETVEQELKIVKYRRY